MRHKLNLDLRDLSRFTTLIHGGYSSGKSHLLGDALRHESQSGEVMFINVKGEDGYLSLAGMGLGERGETVEEYKDFVEVCEEYKGKKIRAMGVDSLKPLAEMVMRKEVGDRLPTVGGNKNEWGEIHWAMNQLMTRLRSVAPIVICVCPSDKSVEQLSGKTFITPDLPGRQAAGSAGWFDFVGYLSADLLGPGKVRRQFHLAPNGNIITRQRLPKPILSPIDVPDVGGGWAKFREAVEKAMGVEA